MTTLTIGVTAWSVQSAKPATKYGQVNPVPLGSSAKELIRFSLERIPSTAIIQSAYLQQWVSKAGAGAYTVQVRRITSAWGSGVTWNTRPSVSAVLETTTTASGLQSGNLVQTEITAEVQAIVNGTQPNLGFQVDTTATGTPLSMRGTNADARPPQVVITYVVPADPPSNLHPSSGLVTVPKPVLTFDGPADMTSERVQISATQNWAAPDFDSGSIPSSGGLLDLSTTSYAGIGAGNTTYWRAMIHNAAGDSDWSDPVSMTQQTNPTLAFTSPTSSTIHDGTQTISAAFDDGSQPVAWRAQFIDSEGNVLDDSDYVGAATAGATLPIEWTPDKGLRTPGDTGTYIVQAWPDTDAVATPGVPEYVEVSLDVTLSSSATVAPLVGLAADSPGITPDVTLTGTRSAIPDEVIINRVVDGHTKRLARVPGTDVFTGTAFTYVDAGAPAHQQVTYDVICVTDGDGWSTPVSATITPTVKGIWLYNPSDPTERALIATGDEQTNTSTEVAVVHEPIVPGPQDGSLGVRVVRRRLVRFQPSSGDNPLTGLLVDAAGILASDSAATLRSWAANDAGTVYRLVMGNLALDVILGDIDLQEVAANNATQRVIGVSFNWWGADDDYTVKHP